jgi:RNA polymerase sigma-70 factor, ECF subfamily
VIRTHYAGKYVLTNVASDTDDIRATLDGDEVAYARLVERYESQVFLQMWRFTRDRRVIEELVQDVFVEIYFSLGSFGGGARFPQWIRKIATRVGYRYWKTENRTRNRQELLAQHGQFRVQVVPREPSEAAEALFQMLERLAPRDRLVLTLYYYDQCDTREISERTGWSQVLVRVQMHRACQKLKRMLKEAGYGPNGMEVFL